VDRFNNGSHRDMDIFTFLSSTSALWPYFAQCTKIGMETANLAPSETFRRLRWAGKRAEHTMKYATGGVNTHKGAIFSMGVLCGAAGRLGREKWPDPASVLDECAAITAGLTQRDFQSASSQTAQTVGQKLFFRYGITGVRGQVEQGFPTVRNIGLPKLEEGLRQGLSLNDAGCGTLLALIAADTDTNLIARGGRDVQLEVSAQLAELLKRDPFPRWETLEALDRTFIEKNLSPGGSADLLSVTYFLHFLQQT
jgi:holo-ACP synthase/triphosphoribosyl-dephospho-CoA synthase